MKQKLFWGISSIGYLALAYRLTRYTFFSLHGMIQWTNILTIVSLGIIIIASLLGRRISAIATVVAYIGGFALTMLFNSDGVDPGGRSNNAWIIWTVVYFIIILGGFIIDYIIHKRGMNNAN